MDLQFPRDLERAGRIKEVNSMKDFDSFAEEKIQIDPERSLKAILPADPLPAVWSPFAHRFSTYLVEGDRFPVIRHTWLTTSAARPALLHDPDP